MTIAQNQLKSAPSISRKSFALSVARIPGPFPPFHSFLNRNPACYPPVDGLSDLSEGLQTAGRHLRHFHFGPAVLPTLACALHLATTQPLGPQKSPGASFMGGIPMWPCIMYQGPGSSYEDQSSTCQCGQVAGSFPRSACKKPLHALALLFYPG